MKLVVKRIYDDGDATIGMLFIDGKYQCLTLEDEQRTVKVFGETRIPNGEYQIGLRAEGKHHKRYKARYGKKHKGMLEVQNVPNFKYILIHVGNTDLDTAGCLLVGEFPPNPGDSRLTIRSSRTAYEQLYPKVIKALLSGEPVTITYINDRLS